MIKQKVTSSWKQHFVSIQEFELIQSYVFILLKPSKILILFDLNHSIFLKFFALTTICPALYVRILISVF